MLKESRDQIKAFATYAETTDVTTKNRGRDIGRAKGCRGKSRLNKSFCDKCLDN